MTVLQMESEVDDLEKLKMDDAAEAVLGKVGKVSMIEKVKVEKVERVQSKSVANSAWIFENTHKRVANAKVIFCRCAGFAENHEPVDR